MPGLQNRLRALLCLIVAYALGAGCSGPSDSNGTASYMLSGIDSAKIDIRGVWKLVTPSTRPLQLSMTGLRMRLGTTQVALFEGPVPTQPCEHINVKKDGRGGTASVYCFTPKAYAQPIKFFFSSPDSLLMFESEVGENRLLSSHENLFVRM